MPVIFLYAYAVIGMIAAYIWYDDLIGYYHSPINDLDRSHAQYAVFWVAVILSGVLWPISMTLLVITRRK